MTAPFWSIDSRKLFADLETPVSAYLKLRGLGARFLLESVERGTVLGRYSFIGLDPLLEIECDLERAVALAPDGTRFEVEVREDPNELLRAILRCMSAGAPEEPGNLLGGAVGSLSWDFVQSIEDVPVQREPDQPPIGRFVIPASVVTFDHLSRRLTVRTMTWNGTPQREPDLDAAGLAAVDALAHSIALPAPASADLDRVIQALEGPMPAIDPGPGREFVARGHPTQQEYENRVLRAKELIRAGDIFQVVLSQKLEGPLEVDSFQLYRALRMLNPSPYLFFLDFEPTYLVGSSPEVLVKLSGREATVRPIAGTRPRGESPAEDRAYAAELHADEKERAEHVMLVDLGRNDLGRVCEYGSVEVTDFMTLERYSHVMHLVSYVRGTLRPEFDAFDLLRATFPAGTVSGAPKVRAMEIIDELEDRPRGAYAGAVGYLSPRGDMDLCITIRTVLCHDGVATLQAGAGIVADSDPAAEHDECHRKMAALLAAVQLASRGLR